MDMPMTDVPSGSTFDKAWLERDQNRNPHRLPNPKYELNLPLRRAICEYMAHVDGDHTSEKPPTDEPTPQLLVPSYADRPCSQGSHETKVYLVGDCENNLQCMQRSWIPIPVGMTYDIGANARTRICEVCSHCIIPMWVVSSADALWSLSRTYREGRNKPVTDTTSHERGSVQNLVPNNARLFHAELTVDDEHNRGTHHNHCTVQLW